MNHPGLEEVHRRLETPFRNDALNVTRGDHCDIPGVSLTHSFDTLGGKTSIAHQLKPELKQPPGINPVHVRRQIGADQDTMGEKTMGDASKERHPLIPVQNELGNQECRGPIERRTFRERIEIAGMQDASLLNPMFLGFSPEDFQHGGGGFNGREAPSGKSPGEINDLTSRARSNAKKMGVWRKR